MSRYVRQLADLGGAVAHNVLDPTQGFDALQQLVSGHADQVTARRQAQSEGYDALAQLAYESSMDGATADQLLANPQFQSGASSLRPKMQGALQDQLQSLFTPQGVSALAPTVPPEDAAALGNEIIKAQNQGLSLPAIKQTIHAHAQQVYGDAYPRMFPAIEDLIDSTYQGPSTGITPTVP